METVDWVIIIGLLIMSILYIGIIVFQKRNIAVYKFYLRTIDICEEWNERHRRDIAIAGEPNAFEWFILRGPTYNDIMFSFKPVTLEAWYEKDKLKKLFE